MHLKKTGLAGLISASFFLGSCHNPVAPPPPPVKTAPVVNSIIANPSAPYTNMSTLFTIQTTAKDGLDSLVMNFGDGTQKTLQEEQKTASTDTVSHTYITAGTDTATATAYSQGLTGQKSTTVKVGANLPPVITADSLNTVEGQESGMPLNKFANSPEGRPVTVQFTNVDPSIIITETSDSIKVRGATTNTNGTYQSTAQVTDNQNLTTTKKIITNIAARDVIALTVGDIRKGTIYETLFGVMNPPFDTTNSAVLIDGARQKMDPQGNIKTGKIKSQTHTVDIFLVDQKGDSSFQATYYLPPGDQTASLGVNTAVGTGQTLANLQKFMKDVNFPNTYQYPVNFMLQSIDFTHASNYVFWISQKDTNMLDDKFFAFTPAEQDSVESYIKTIYQYIPTDKQPRIYKAALNESLPDPSSQISFLPNYILILKRTGASNDYSPGLNAIFDINLDGVLDGAVTSLFVPFDRTAGIKECLSSLVAPNDLIDPLFYNISILNINHRSSNMTNLDVYQLENGLFFSKYVTDSNYVKNGFVTQNTFWKIK